MFFRRRGDEPHLIRRSFHGGDDAAQSFSRFSRKFRHLKDAAHGSVHHAYAGLGPALDGTHGRAHVLGGAHGFFRKLAHFVRHHGKTPARFPGPRRLNGRVQSQQVSLIGYVGNNIHDLADALGLLAQFIHGVLQGSGFLLQRRHPQGHLADDLFPAFRLASGGIGSRGGVRGIAGHFLHRGAHLRHGGGCFRNPFGLDFRTGSGLLHPAGKLFRGRGYGVGHLAQAARHNHHGLGFLLGDPSGQIRFLHGFSGLGLFLFRAGGKVVGILDLGFQRGHHGQKTVIQHADFVRAVKRELGVQVARADGFGRLHDLPQGHCDKTGDEKAQPQAERNGETDKNEQVNNRVVIFRGGIVRGFFRHFVLKGHQLVKLRAKIGRHLFEAPALLAVADVFRAHVRTQDGDHRVGFFVPGGKGGL